VWELEVGAVLAWAPQHLKATAAVASLTHRTTFWLREAVSFCGVSLLVLVGLPWIGVDEEMMFPGWIAWLPTLGTALVIAAGDGCCGQVQGVDKIFSTDAGGGEGGEAKMPLPRLPFLNRVVIGNRLMAFLGRISYPVSLWHWPLYIFATLALAPQYRGQRAADVVEIGMSTWACGNLGWNGPPRFGQPRFEFFSLTAAIILLAVITTYGIENPLRNHPWPKIPAALSVCVFALFVFGLLLRWDVITGLTGLSDACIFDICPNTHWDPRHQQPYVVE
jgi:peptidoglycan/LPS O-acetylase OafA/YrhL